MIIKKKARFRNRAFEVDSMHNKFKLLSKIPFYKLSHATGWPKMLPVNLTLSVSPTCNSRCKTCNIWKKKENDFKSEEWDKTMASLGNWPFWITISGGEPFLKRQELVELVKICYLRNKPAIINIPTNSLLYAFTPKYVEEMCRSIPGAQLIINLSVDGVGEKHDYIRGITGNFKRVLLNLENLKNLQKKYSNLTIGIHSVISNFNYPDVDELYNWAFSVNPDQYITEIAEERVELDTKGLPITPSWENYSQAINKLIGRIKQKKFKGVSRFTEAFRLEYYNNVKKYLKTRKQVIPCYAGLASGQIYANGDVWQCCIDADVLGNLREANYDFKKIWFSKRADEIRKKVKRGGCGCPLANASYTNMLMDFRTLLRIIANYF